MIILQFLASLNLKKNIGVDYGEDDLTGDETINVLKSSYALAKRMTGNDKGSLGLHPAVYYYGPSGVHSSSMFLGTALLLSEKLSNNDSQFFFSFSKARGKIEEILIENKDLIATILQKLGSKKRVEKYKELLGSIYSAAKNNENITENDLVSWAGLEGKVIVGQEKPGKEFSEETKSKIFIYSALKTQLRCPICTGYIDTSKSASYDHIVKKEDGGDGHLDNAQITHPFCNQSIKN